MTCHHRPGDPACGQDARDAERRDADYRVKEAQKTVADLLARSPNPEAYEIQKIQQVGLNLVVMVQYSSCKNCSFDSKKILVYKNTGIHQAVFWKKIDPHFVEKHSGDKKHAPSPAARFPGNDRGWAEALEYAEKVISK